MAAPKFPLKMGDGFPARTLEELRAHADLYNLEKHFEDHSLQRWLTSRDYEAAAAVEALDMEAEDVLDQLCAILAITVTEEMYKAYEERKEEALATAEKLIAKTEMEQKTEGLSEPGDEKKFCPQMVSISDDVADKIANLLNDKDDLYTYVETDHYILFSSHSARGLSKIDDSSGAPIFLAMLRSVTTDLFPSLWYRIDKETGNFIKFSIQAADNENMLPNSYLPPRVNYTVCGDCIAYVQNNRLIQLDIERQEIRIIAEEINSSGLKFAKESLNGMVAFCNEDGLYLACLTGITEITARGNSIHASALSLSKDSLYFFCENTMGLLDDASNPNGCYCLYSLETKRISIVVSKKKIEELGGPQPHALYGDNLFCVCRENERAGGNAKLPLPAVYIPGLIDDPSKENLWGTINITTGSVTLHQKGEFPGSFASVHIQVYRRGILLSKFEYIPQAYFVDYVDGEKMICFPKETASTTRSFLLGQWFYYVIQNDDQRTRWKVSLDDPDNPIQL